MSKGQSREKFTQKLNERIPGLVHKTEAIYAPNIHQTTPHKDFKSPKFDRMLNRTLINSIYK